MSTIIEKYEQFIEIQKMYLVMLNTKLAELGTTDLTSEEREYQNDLMSGVKRANHVILSAEHTIKRIKFYERDET